MVRFSSASLTDGEPNPIPVCQGLVCAVLAGCDALLQLSVTEDKFCLACILGLGSLSHEIMIYPTKHHARWFTLSTGNGNIQRGSAVASVLSDTPWPTSSLTFHHGSKNAPSFSPQRQESCLFPEDGPFEDPVSDYPLTKPSATRAGHQFMSTIKSLRQAAGNVSMGRNHSD